MSFGQIIRPAGTAGSPHSSVASSRTVARSLIGNPAGSTSRTCRFGGLVDSMKTIRVSFGIARHSATSFDGPGPIITPPGLIPLGDGCAAAPPADARAAGPPDAAVPDPATVVPQAARPIIRPAAMPPSAARLAGPSGLPSVLIATPFRTGAVPRVAPPGPPPGGSAGPAWPPVAGPAVSGRAGAWCAPHPALYRRCGPARLPQPRPHL